MTANSLPSATHLQLVIVDSSGRLAAGAALPAYDELDPNYSPHREQTRENPALVGCIHLATKAASLNTWSGRCQSSASEYGQLA